MSVTGKAVGKAGIEGRSKDGKGGRDGKGGIEGIGSREVKFCCGKLGTLMSILGRLLISVGIDGITGILGNTNVGSSGIEGIGIVIPPKLNAPAIASIVAHSNNFILLAP
jgi:hypothetical protein